MIGQTLGGYQIVEEIGSGGMATVYKAYDPGTDRHVAIKVLPDHYSRNSSFRERFQREAKAIARLEHVHILPVFGYGEDAGRAYLVMRYMPEGTLSDLLHAGPLPLDEASRLLTQMAAALDAAHEQGIIHRDIKPSNILLDKHRNAYLSDFGIAKILEVSQQITGSGLIGTPPYMSPEQCTGDSRLTGASDQYSLGVILYQMVTGSVPFEGETPISIIMGHINLPLPDPRALRPDLSEATVQVIGYALAKNPQDRYQTCSEMAAAFAHAITGRADATAPSYAVPKQTEVRRVFDNADVDSPDTTRLAGKPQRRIKPLVWIAGGAALLVIVTIAALLMSSGALGQQSGSVTLTPASIGTTYLILTQQNIDLATKRALSTQTAADVPTSTPDPVELAEYLTYCQGDICINGGGHAPIELGLRDSFQMSTVAREFTWSPDGTQFAFVAGVEPSNLSIYLANRDGSNVRPLRYQADMPAWQPDGDWIAYHYLGNVNIVRSDGTGERTLAAGNQSQTMHFPIWSPDGQSIAWSEGVDWGNMHTIWVMNLDGTDRHPVYIDHENLVVNGELAWNPDGQSIVFRITTGVVKEVAVSCDAGTEPCEAIVQGTFTIPPHWTHIYFPQWAGEIPTTPDPLDLVEVLDYCLNEICISGPGEARTAVDLPGQYAINATGFSWSPDGSRILFEACPDVAVADWPCEQIYSVNRDGSDLQTIAGPSSHWPTMSPDGQWIAYGDGCVITVMHPDGSAKARIYSSGTGCSGYPVWSPDSQYISWLDDDTDARVYAAWVAKVDGTELHPIYYDPEFNDEIAWQPNGWSPDGRSVAVKTVSGATYLLDAFCDVRSDANGCRDLRGTLPEYPSHWGHRYYPQWAGEVVARPLRSIGGHDVLGVVRTESFGSSSLPFELQRDEETATKFAVQNGMLSMTKEIRTDHSPGIRTQFTLGPGNAWVVRFRLAQNSIYGFHFESYSSPSAYVGFNGDGDLAPGISNWSLEGAIPESGTLGWIGEGLLPDIWYLYVVALHADGEIYVAIIPEDAPASRAFEIHDNFGAEWASHDFTVIILGHQGVMYIDNFQELELAD